MDYLTFPTILLDSLAAIAQAYAAQHEPWVDAPLPCSPSIVEFPEDLGLCGDPECQSHGWQATLGRA